MTPTTNDTQEQRERQLRQDTPWILWLTPRVMKNYLNYKGSAFASPTRIKVTYWIRTNTEGVDADVDHPQDKQYEDLWLKNGKAIGLHRYSFRPNLVYDGQLVVRRTPDMADCTDDIADAIVRVMLETTELPTRPPVRGCSVPAEIVTNVEAALVSQYNFSSILVMRGPAKFTVHLMSDPPIPAYDKYYMYNGP
ncbi:MAG TPA: hypothetical protein V6C81_01435 [Planktothrix sp.]